MDWPAPLFRALNPFYARAPLSGEGARRFGGRFNRPGRPALYLAETALGALRETTRAGRMQPIVLVEYHGAPVGLFDATDAGALAARGAPDPADPDWLGRQMRGEAVPTQGFAETLIAEGFPGLVVPSYAPGAPPGGRNVVLWRWEGLRVVDDEGRLR